MSKYNFGGFQFSYENILKPHEVISCGILYDDEKFSFETYRENGSNHYERLFYTDEHGEKSPFSGLIYELYPNGMIQGYSYYNGGYKDGEDVDFYDNGSISKYVDFRKNESRALIMEWSKDGAIDKIEIQDNSERPQKHIKYDIDGNIIGQ